MSVLFDVLFCTPVSGSMAPPPTPPPPSSTPSFIPAPPSPSVHPNPGRVITPTLEGVAGRVATPTGIASGQMPHSVAVTITMAGGGSIAVPVSMGLVGHSRTGRDFKKVFYIHGKSTAIRVMQRCFENRRAS